DACPGSTPTPAMSSGPHWRRPGRDAESPRPRRLDRGQAASSFSGSRVEVIVLEIPGAGDGGLPADGTIGVWARTALATDAGGWRQTNRAAIPMVWPLLRAMGGADDSDRY